jgi:ribosomal protein L13E
MNYNERVEIHHDENIEAKEIIKYVEVEKFVDRPVEVIREVEKEVIKYVEKEVIKIVEVPVEKVVI